MYKNAKGEDRYILVRNAGTNTVGRMETYTIDMNTCLPTAKSEVFDFGGQSHEFFLWHDPANQKRVLVFMTNWTSGLPDPDRPGLKTSDGPDGAGRHRRGHGRALGESEDAGRVQPPGGGRSAGEREARRNWTFFRRSLPGLQR